MASLKQVLNEKLVQPFLKAKATRHEIALGGAIGMFWALNPLVGIQMMLVMANWIVFKAIGIRFSSPIGVAMVWLTNPVTMPFFYYGFYYSGVYALTIFGNEINLVNFESFKFVLVASLEMDTLEGLQYWLNFMIVELGLPMLLGGIMVATPISIVTYPAVYRILTKVRTNKAIKEGLSLEDWEWKFINQGRNSKATKI